MHWLSKIVDEVEARQPDDEIIVETGSAPSGPYHFGHLREIITADAIVKELQRRGRQARHIHFVDDFDALRKVPASVPAEYEKYLGRPLADIPGPSSGASYADYFLSEFLNSAKQLGIQMEVQSGRQKYREGFFTEAIEKALEQSQQIRSILESVSGHKLEDTWSPIQVMEDEYLKKRPFIKLDKQQKTLYYKDKEGQEQSVKYSSGQVKLDWRIDWPARWWLLNVALEPSGRDHATKGGSIDTGMEIQRRVFGTTPPLQVGYDFVNLVGDTKKMSASAGTGVTAEEVMQILPPEIVRFFMLRYPPQKRLYFDPSHVAQLIDEFAELLAKEDKTEAENRLVKLSTNGVESVISNIPFSHLVASYQAALHNPQKTLEIILRTEHKDNIEKQREVILKELSFIQNWLKRRAPEDIKFELLEQAPTNLEAAEQKFLKALAEKVAQASPGVDGEWFHKTIYELKEAYDLQPKQAFGAIYKATIGKTSGPRAGWFLSILPRDWLVKRLRLER